jgi:hypothetical protein
LLMPGIFFLFTTKAILLQTAQLTVYILQISFSISHFITIMKNVRSQIHYLPF